MYSTQKLCMSEHQPPHLVINDPEKFQKSNIEEYGLPEEAFWPAEVYELHVDRKTGAKSLRIYIAENWCSLVKLC